MSGLTRQEVKRDRVQEWLITASDWLFENYKKLLVGVACLAALGAVVALVMAQRGKADERSQELLAEAIEIYEAPLVSAEDLEADAAADDGADEADDAGDDAEDGPRFTTEEERRAAAMAAMEEVYEKHGSRDAGRIAGVYLGDLAIQSGDVDRARELWSKFLATADSTALAATVRLNLISLDRQMQPEALIEELRSEAEGGAGVLPVDALLYELGRTLEVAGRRAEAEEVYQRIIDEHPGSPYISQARERIQT